MSSSHSSDEFSYQTHLVVYNFLGLVPATPSPSEDDLENSQNETQQGGKPRLVWNDALETLPTMSLIDRLSESEVQQMQMKKVCDEVANKVRLVEPTTLSSPSESSSRPADQPIERDKTFRKKTSDRFDRDVAHQAILNELKHQVSQRGPSPNDSGSEELSLAPITIIQKKNGFKILGEGVSAFDEADVCRQLSLQPTGASVRPSGASVKSDVPLGKSSVYMQSQSSAIGGSGNKAVFTKRPVTLLSTSGLTVSREMLTQIDEDQELSIASEASADDVPLFERSNQDQDNLVPTTSAQNSASRASAASTPISYDRQSSGMSSSSRRCSTYVDINDVDVENLVKAKALPPATLPLKRELSVAFEKLERNYKSDYSDDVDHVNHNVDNRAVTNGTKSPESDVADSLRALGDRIQEEYGPRLNSIVHELLGASPDQSLSYSSLQNATSRLLRETHNGWTRVTLVMLLGQHLIYELLRQGYSGINHVAEFTARLVEDHAADFIVNSGGWNSISDIGIVETGTVLTPLSVDSSRIPEFDSKSANSLPGEDSDSEITIVETSEEAVVSKSSDILGSKPLDLSSPQTSKVDSDPMKASADVNPGLPGGLTLASPIMTSTPTGTVQPPNPNIEEEFLISRQNSQQYVGEREAAEHSVVWTQSGVVAGLVLMVVLASWIIYRRVRRST